MMKFALSSRVVQFMLPFGVMSSINLSANALTQLPSPAVPANITAQRVTPQAGIKFAGIKFKMPDMGAPGNRDGGSTRGNTCSVDHKPMIALLPPTKIGLTTSDRPDIFVYVPTNSGRMAEFLLMNEDNTEILYETSFPITGEAGIYKVTVATNNKSTLLQSGKNYHWYFSVVCTPNERSADLLVNGWIKRVDLATKFTSELKHTAPRDRPSLYANASLWYETVSSLAALRCTHPTDTAIKTDWETFLRSVGLEGIAQAPLKQNCLATK